MFGAPPKPASRPSVTVEELPSPSICSVEPMNRSIAYWPASWHSTRLDRSDAVRAGEEHVRPCRDVAGHAALRCRSSATVSTQPHSIAGMSVGCGLSVQLRQILPRSPSCSPYVGSISSIAAVLNPMPWLSDDHLVALVDAADGDHRHQDLHRADRLGSRVNSGSR